MGRISITDNDKTERQKAADKIVKKNIEKEGGKQRADGKWDMKEAVEREKQKGKE